MNTVADWMTPDPVTIEPEAQALEAFDQMVDGGFRHLPVVNPQGDLLGVVSVDDLRTVCPIPTQLGPLPLEGRELSSSPIRRACFSWLCPLLPVAS